jgi:hypothetical protein
MLSACSRDTDAGVIASSQGVVPARADSLLRTSAVRTSGEPSRAPYGVVAALRYAGDAGQLAPDATVYVFLRVPGERMPLAVQYFHASELPKRVMLATTAARTDVELVGRLSLAGQVDRAAGDPETRVLLHRVGHPPETVDLVLGETAAAVGQPAPVVAAAPAQRAISVRARVSIDSTIGLARDATVYVIARSGRAPMPLAVKRLTVAELPAEIELGDADAMLMSRRLSDARSITILARVSDSGSTAASLDDPESAALTVDARAIPDALTLAIHNPRGAPGAR